LQLYIFAGIRLLQKYVFAKSYRNADVECDMKEGLNWYYNLLNGRLFKLIEIT